MHIYMMIYIKEVNTLNPTVRRSVNWDQHKFITLACLGLPGPAWACLGLPLPVWACLGLSGPAWACLGLPGPAWACLVISTIMSGLVWAYYGVQSLTSNERWSLTIMDCCGVQSGAYCGVQSCTSTSWRVQSFSTCRGVG